MVKKYIVIFTGLAAAVAGIVGPAVFIESMGQLNLFELSVKLKEKMYYQIGLGFVAIVVLSFLFALIRFFIGVVLLAITGLGVWGVSYYYFQDFHMKALQQVKGIGFKDGFINGVNALALKTLQLQWGAYVLLAGLAVMLLSVFIRRR